MDVTHLSLAMMLPNFVYMIIALQGFCAKRGIEWSADVFFYIFSLRVRDRYVTSGPRSPSFFKTFGLPDTHHSWKTRYCFITSPEGWPIPTYPGQNLWLAVPKPARPVPFGRWVDDNPAPFYILDVVTLELLLSDKKKKKAESSEGGGSEEGASEPTAKKQKTKQSKSTTRKQTPVAVSSTSSSSSSSDSGEDQSENSPSDKSIDIVGVDEPTLQNQPEHRTEQTDIPSAADFEIPEGMDFDFPESSTPPPNSRLPYINMAGNLELSLDSDVPLFNDSLNPFGSAVAAFTRSETDAKTLEKLESENLIDFAQNQTLNVSQAMTAMAEALRKAKAESAELSRLNELAAFESEQASLQYKTLEANMHDVQEEVKTLRADKGILSSTLKRLTLELENTHELFGIAAASDLEHIAQIAELKAALASKEKEVADLREQESHRASSSNVVATDEMYEACKSTPNYVTDMVDFLEQGFDKFRRSALRHIGVQSSREVIEGIEFNTANEEDEAEFLTGDP